MNCIVPLKSYVYSAYIHTAYLNNTSTFHMPFEVHLYVFVNMNHEHGYVLAHV